MIKTVNNPSNHQLNINGVIFIQHLWEECKPELEQLDQKAVDYIWEQVLRCSPRKSHFESESDKYESDKYELGKDKSDKDESDLDKPDEDESD